MKYAIISDVHANDAALDAVLADARMKGARRIICLGDVVGYGPEAAAVVARVRKACAAVIAGNHDDAVSGRCSAEDFNDFAAEAVERNRTELDADAISWLASLPYVFSEDGFACAHGEFAKPERFDYVFEAEDAVPSWNARSEQLLFVGHTHVPQLFVVGASGTPHKLEPQDFVLEEGKRYLVNPGSVGFPRSGAGPCYSTYCLYDSDEGAVEFKTVPFDLRSVMPTGRGTKRFPVKRAAAAAIAAVVVAAALAYVLAPAEKTVTKTVVNTVTETRTVVKEVESTRYESMKSETLKLPVGAKKVEFEVKLVAKSEPVQINLSFKDAEGRPVGEVERMTVKKSVRRMGGKAVAVPKGAAYAVLDVCRDRNSEKAGATCAIAEFSFAAITKS